jgi:hypothetical protein
LPEEGAASLGAGGGASDALGAGEEMGDGAMTGGGGGAGGADCCEPPQAFRSNDAMQRPMAGYMGTWIRIDFISRTLGAISPCV